MLLIIQLPQSHLADQLIWPSIKISSALCGNNPSLSHTSLHQYPLQYSLKLAMCCSSTSLPMPVTALVSSQGGGSSYTSPSLSLKASAFSAGGFPPACFFFLRSAFVNTMVMGTWKKRRGERGGARGRGKRGKGCETRGFS